MIHGVVVIHGVVWSICREGGVSPCGVLLGLIYIQRLAANNPAYLTTMSPRLLFLIAMVMDRLMFGSKASSYAIAMLGWSSWTRRSSL